MSIWKASNNAANIGNVLGYFSLFIAAVLTGASLVVPLRLVQVVGMFSVATTIIGVFLTFWASSIRDRNSDFNIATAQTSADESKAKAMSLEIENTKLKSDLEEQRRRFATLSQAVAPRALSEIQIEKLCTALDKCIGPDTQVTIRVSPGKEPLAFAMQIYKLLQNLGIRTTVKEFNGIITGTENHGHHVFVSFGPFGDEIAKAFNDIAQFRVLRAAPREEYNKREAAFDLSDSVEIMIFPKGPLAIKA